MSISLIEFEMMFDYLPENKPLYKDSGLWQIRSDDMEDVIFQQYVNESFFNFIARVSKINPSSPES